MKLLLTTLLALTTAVPAANVEITPAGVTASTSDANVATNAVDNNYGTRWSGDGDGATLTLDLGATKTVSHLKVAAYKGDERKNDFELQVLNGSTWTTVYDGLSSGTSTALQTFDFTDQEASKIRYVGHGYQLNSGGTGTWNSITEIEVWGSGGSDPTPQVPADVLDLSNWKVTLPIGSDENPTEIKQPALDSYSNAPFFTVAGDGVQFRAPVNGVTTSGSSYPRSELREMKGSSNASWSSTSGTHTLVVRESFDHLPAGKPHLVGAQIHDSADDVTVFRLEGIGQTTLKCVNVTHA